MRMMLICFLTRLSVIVLTLFYHMLIAMQNPLCSLDTEFLKTWPSDDSISSRHFFHSRDDPVCSISRFSAVRGENSRSTCATAHLDDC